MAPALGFRTRLTVGLAVAVLFFAGCSDDDDTLSTGPSTTASAPNTTVAPVAYDRVGEPEEIGNGFVVETSLDGSAVYVRDEDDRFDELGCEGAQEAVLLRLPIAGGPPEPIGSPPPVKGDIVRGKDGRVAVVGNCEGFLTDVLVGREGPSGDLLDLKELALEERADGRRAAPHTFTWSSNGQSLLTVVSELGVDDIPSTVVRIDPATGKMTVLFNSQPGQVISQLGQLADGSFVVAAAGSVSLRDQNGVTVRSTEGKVFAITPAGDEVLVGGDSVVSLKPSGVATPILRMDGGREVSTLDISPDGRAAAYSDYSEDDGNNAVVVVTLENGASTPVEGPGQLGRVTFTGDGRGIVYNRFPPGIQSELLAPVIHVPLGD